MKLFVLVCLALFATVSFGQSNFCFNRLSGSYCSGNILYTCQNSQVIGSQQCFSTCITHSSNSASCSGGVNNFCQSRFDGTYCSGTNIVTCQNHQTLGNQPCIGGSQCIQSTSTAARCTSNQVPASFCQTRINGWHCYRQFGSSIEMSVRCDNHQLFQQQVCPDDCDSFSGQCKSSSGGGTSGGGTVQCPSSCQWGCNYGTSTCKPAPYCGQTKIVNANEASFCGSLVGGRQIDHTGSVFALDQNAENLYVTLSAWSNVNYDTQCLEKMKRFACESEFKNCAENGAFGTCNTVCADTDSCMNAQMNTAENATIASLPFSCHHSCNGAGLVTYSVGLLVLVVALVLL